MKAKAKIFTALIFKIQIVLQLTLKNAILTIAEIMDA